MKNDKTKERRSMEQEGIKDRETVGVKADQICLKYLSGGFLRVDHSKGFSLQCYVNFSPLVEPTFSYRWMARQHEYHARFKQPVVRLSFSGTTGMMA